MGKIKQLFLFVIIGAVLLYGCTESNIKQQSLGDATGNVIKEVNESYPDSNIKETPQKEETQESIVKEDKIQTKEKASEKEEQYTAEQLIEDLKDIMDSDYYNFSRDKSHPEYIKSSDLKYYVIHTSNEKINDVRGFCDEYCAQNWNGWKYFINASDLGDLTPILGRGNFSNDAEYMDYITKRSLINHTFIETPYEVENGKVLEYQFISWKQDNFNTFKGAWFGTFLIYKIYCSPNMTVFLRPKWDEYKDLSFPAATMSNTYRTWANYIKPQREKILERANKVLDSCPVEKDFFQDYSFPDYFKSEMLSYYWKTDYKYLWNLTTSIKAGIKPSNEEGKYILKEINISFTNWDEYSINEDIGLKVTVNPDGKGEDDYYESSAGGKLQSGKSIELSLRKKDIKFSNNITIGAKLYTIEGNVDIRPSQVTFTKADLVLG